MTNDPYADVKRPIRGGSVEIGQPTFVELIWARTVSTRATGGALPTVDMALNAVAYGESPYELREPTQRNQYYAASNIIVEPAIVKYTLGQEAKAFKDKVKGISAARESIQFKEFVKNDVYNIYATPADCFTIDEFQGNDCPNTDCHIDVVWSVDNSGSMTPAIEAIKGGITGLVNIVNSISAGSYRHALQTFGQTINDGNLITVLPLTDAPCGNVSEFALAANSMVVGGRTEPWHQAIESVVNRGEINSGLYWHYREDADVRLLIIVTDEAEDYVQFNDAYAAAQEMARCGIRLVFVWTDVYDPNLVASGHPSQIPIVEPWNTLDNYLNDITELTDGYWIWAPDGENMVELLASYMLGLCADAALSTCPGGENKILNGKFDTSIANWEDISTISDRDMGWDAYAMTLTGASRQVVSGLTPGDLVILSFEAALSAPTGFAAQSISKFAASTGAPFWSSQCIKNYVSLGYDDFITTQSFNGWSGTGAVINPEGMELSRNEFTGGTSTTDDELYLALSDGIWVSDLDGSGLTQLIPTGNIRDIAIDNTRKRIYWAEQTYGGVVTSIFSAYLDGSDKKEVIREGTTDDSTISSITYVQTQDRVYYCYYDASVSEIRSIDVINLNERMELDLSGISSPTDPVFIAPIRIEYEQTDNVMYLIMSTGRDGSLMRFSIDGWVVSNLTTIRDDIIDMRDFQIDRNNSKLYVNSGNTLLRMDLDGTNEEIVTEDLEVPSSFFLDIESGRIFISEVGVGNVSTIDLSGNNKNALYQSQIYPSTIARASKTSSVVSKIFTDLTVGDNISFAIDVGELKGKLYIQLLDGENVLAEKQYSPGTVRPLAAPTFVKLSGCGVSPYILNGASSDLHPAIGQVGSYQATGDDIFFCTGTIISNRHVLTAAHCLYDSGGNLMPDTWGRFKIQADTNNYETVFNSVRVYPHPDYDPTTPNGTDTSNDIAIIELDQDITEAGIIGLEIFEICSVTFAGSVDGPSVGDQLEIWGYGLNGTGSSIDPNSGDIKRYGYVNIDEITSTLIKWNFDDPTESSTIYGDSGGPQFYEVDGKRFIASIASGGDTLIPGGDIGIIPSVAWNTKVAAYDIWIKDIITGPTVIAPVPASGQITASIRLVPELNESGFADIENCVICYEPTIIEPSGLLKYSLRDENSTILRNGQVEDTNLNIFDDYTTFELTGNVGIDGTIEVRFDAESGKKTTFYIDNVLLCVLKEDDCGPGRNGIINPNFRTGVEFWNDGDNNPILPTDDPDVWDSLLSAITISISGAAEARTNVVDLRPGRNYSLNFEIAAFQPDLDILQFTYGILDESGTVLVQNDTTRGVEKPFPKRVQVDFQAPSSGTVIPFFKAGITSGAVKIRNVLICTGTGTCDPGYSAISYDNFETGRGAWAGGSHDVINQLIRLEAYETDDSLSQTFNGLEAGATLQLTFNSLAGANGAGKYLIEFHSNGLITQFTTNSDPGVKSYESIVQSGGTVTIIITNLQPYSVEIDDILICEQDQLPCDGSIDQLEVQLEWDGIPRKPTNIFNLIAKYTIRDPNDPFVTSVVTHIAENEGVSGIPTCSKWKQQGQSGNVSNEILGTGLSPSTVGNIVEGDFASVASRANWIWAVPDTGGIPDTLSITLPTAPAGLIESVEILLLMNYTTPDGVDTSPVTPPPLLCDPDPASELITFIEYVASTGLRRRFDTRIHKNNIWQQQEDFTTGSPWDTVSSIGNGRKGSTARWQSLKFNLDTVDGRGLDQCTTPISFNTIGQGVLVFGGLDFKNGRGIFVDSCLSEIIITNGAGDSISNELQAIVLPSPSGGTWDVSFTQWSTTQTARVAWDADAAELQSKLTSLSNIEDDDVLVTGSGTESDPFLVEFTGILTGIDVRPLVCDGINLTGSATAFISTLTDGTVNERQVLSRNTDTQEDFIITFAGESTIPLSYESSLHTRQAALEGLSTIGAGNIRVTGNTTDRISAYVGDTIIDFIGNLGNQNVIQMSVEPAPDYSVTTEWTGVTGVDEQQRIAISASGGSFSLRIFEPGSEPTSAPFSDTGPIPFNASPSTLKDIIVADISWLTDTDIIVVDDPVLEANAHQWIVRWTGNYAKTDIQQMTIFSGSLRGGPITVVELNNGSGSEKKQIVQIVRASAGSFKLGVTISGTREWTTPIPWNTTAAGVQAQLIALSLFEPGDVIVVDNGDTGDAEINASFTVTFAKKFGNVPLMDSDFQLTLLCDPLYLDPVIPGPYQYEIPECDDLQDISCQSGPLLCRPGEGDPESELDSDPCCTNETITTAANVSTRLQIEKDLFDPNRKTSRGTYLTLRDMALLKGLQIGDYVPYERNWTTGELTSTSWTSVASTKKSFVLIEAELDTQNGRTRVKSHLSSHREILPDRSVWPENGN